MSKSQVDSNTDFVEQSNILDLLQQRQTLKGQFRFQFSRNKISIETRKELVQYLDFYCEHYVLKPYISFYIEFI